ncbi:transcriptional regulator, LacI family [Beutenbergia cavernae DSM 12333]|uniref:Transcriptional regulator, LacI family n=1 Tax=Beutenbergia cavernae (strain ATCC BAA-8 / DSM 12333 / CCUG 43141 / JCM 11478 / NBRC 16432 / NCIMB 13614 / HKI 0122) TaxID=471853 RepID=C5C377_BEUC1|nr:LacI family DNA-binding transcriptional regulator [Beutenbergia cavernae]ACQ79776.1 transcriptional regulator, LacI family [Beutenbergia cavernae DSM 12333]
MAVTMRDVAKRAGVSVKTVSNVVSGEYPYIRPETRARVVEAIEDLGYRLNVSARQMRTNRTDVIGLALPELRLQYFAELADEVIRAAAEEGLRVVIEQVEHVEHVAVDHMIGTGAHLLDGAIVAPTSQADVAPESAPRGFPIVVLGDRRIGDDVDQVYLANATGARLAVNHLLDVGCRRIVALGGMPGETTGNAGERTAGYADALAARGVDVDPDLVVPTSAWTMAAGAQSLSAILERGTTFDGVFAFSDSIAIGALGALAQAGVRVPDDVAVVGFDDIDDAAHAVPPLTSVAVDRARTAHEAVRLLVRRLRADTPPPTSAVEIGATLVVRASSTRSA